MSIREEDSLYYQTLHDFRTSENRAFESRSQLFLVINSILAAGLAHFPDLPKEYTITVVVFGLVISLIAITVGLRIGVSLDLLQAKLKEYEQRIWAGVKPAEGGPYTYWETGRKSKHGWWLWWPSTRKLVAVAPMVLFFFAWTLLLLWRLGVFG
jgi:hypothetical protein